MAAPFVRKLARDLGVRLEDVAGSGPQGRVRVADVEAFARSRAAPSPTPPPDGALEERVPLQGLRKRIAERMVQAMRHAPQVTAIDLFDVTDLVRAREQLQPLAEAEGVKLTYLPFVVKAAVEALKQAPAVNASVDEEAGAIVLKRYYNVGIATAVPGGLVVPVIRGADRLSILEIAREISRLVEAARARRSTPQDLAGGTFSITSFGGLAGGVLYATPILNYPEVAILGVGRVEQQPRVLDGQVVPRACMGVSFTFDHRALDGEGAAQFLAALRRWLEHPLELLLRLR
jgi:pyruvate dehydrogenase E2 component (dihydrolipoamide acetyltransferase)